MQEIGVSVRQHQHIPAIGCGPITRNADRSQTASPEKRMRHGHMAAGALAHFSKRRLADTSQCGPQPGRIA